MSVASSGSQSGRRGPAITDNRSGTDVVFVFSGRRTRSVVDVQGRLSRASEVRDTAQQSEPVHARRSNLN